jgi:transcriptional antiterminator Rof (Rho-off)
MSTSYRPIACALHDEFEIAVMHKKPISIRWHDEKGGINQGVVLAKDLLVKNKEEFLLVVTRDKNELCIRLDKITLLA